MRTLRIGLIGAGGIVLQRHLPGLRKLEGIEIAAVANSSLASAEAFVRDHAREATALEDWHKLAALPDLDIVWIGATPYLHAPATLAALAAGRHVFCQARMARNVAEADSMLAAAQQRPDLVTMLCPPPQGLKYDAFIKKLLAENTLGEIRSVRVHSLNGSFLDPAKPAHWRQRREISGRNILTLGIHTEVLHRWFGDFAVTAAQGKVFVPERDGCRVEVPDLLDVQAVFANGALGTFAFSGCHPGAPIESIKIIGSTAALGYDYTKEEITLTRPGQKPEVLTPPSELTRDWQVEADFIHAVRHPGAPRPHPDFTDGLRYMRIVERVNEFL